MLIFVSPPQLISFNSLWFDVILIIFREEFFIVNVSFSCLDVFGAIITIRVLTGRFNGAIDYVNDRLKAFFAVIIAIINDLFRVYIKDRC